jgi:hypothetical protein
MQGGSASTRRGSRVPLRSGSARRWFANAGPAMRPAIRRREAPLRVPQPRAAAQAPHGRAEAATPAVVMVEATSKAAAQQVFDFFPQARSGSSRSVRAFFFCPRQRNLWVAETFEGRLEARLAQPASPISCTELAVQDRRKNIINSPGARLPGRPSSPAQRGLRMPRWLPRSRRRRHKHRKVDRLL